MGNSNLKSTLIQSLRNIPGWRTSRKIVVFESDDWGSIRMPSKEVYDNLIKSGLQVNDSSYDRYDALESGTDLSGLFEVLSRFTDSNGNHPAFTANMLVANPDFARMRESSFSSYHYEHFTDTYSRYPDHSDSFAVLNQGMSEKVFQPQFHGREHLNVSRWIKALQRGNPDVIKAFDMNLFSINSSGINGKPETYLQAFDLDEPSDIESHKAIITDGLKIFRRIFGFTPKSFIAPNYIWHYDLDPVLLTNGIKYFQGKGYRKIPSVPGYEIKRYYMGTKNAQNQIYLRRNCLFEPAFYKKDWVNSCLREIGYSFLLHKPAVIETHRLNYIGFIEPDNRNKNLVLLFDLLRKITNKWPDAEFLNSEELGDLVSKGNELN